MVSATVTLPDGTQEVVIGNTREEIIAKVEAKWGGGAREPVPPLRSMSQVATERVMGGLLNIPEFAARAGQGALNVGRAATGTDMAPIPEGGLLGMPNGREAGAFLDGMLKPENLLTPTPRAVLNAVSGMDGQVKERNLIEADNPASSYFGGILGDTANAMLGRKPFLTNSTDIVAPKLEPVLGKVLREDWAQGLAKLAGRSAEAGIEGAAMSILQGGDPVETAILSSASQVAGKVGMKIGGEVTGIADMLQGDFKGGALKLGIYAFAIGSLMQTLKTIAPVGDDSLIESLETGFDKIPFALLVGALGSMTGAGRVDGNLPVVKGKLPTAFADVLTTLPRQATIDLLRKTTEDETGMLDKAIIRMMSAPDSFEKRHIDALNKGFSEGNFAEVVQDLAREDEKFLSILNAPQGLEKVPVKK